MMNRLLLIPKFEHITGLAIERSPVCGDRSKADAVDFA
jgi:hypothetical protein